MNLPETARHHRDESVTAPEWRNLFQQAQIAHASHPELSGFCPFPDDTHIQTITPHPIAAARHLEMETGLVGGVLDGLRDACIAAGPLAHWRETYKGTDIGDEFMDKFACYCLIGPNGPFASTSMHAYFVYMPAGLWYPWHHHPAEELYLVVAGEGEFYLDGEAPRTLAAGDSAFHPSGQSHALLTRNCPVLAYVLWRNGFGTPPVLSPGKPRKVPQ